MTFVRIDALGDYSSSAYTDMTGMVFPVTSGVLYKFRADIVFQSDTIPGGAIGLTITTPAVTRLAALVYGPTGTVDAVNQEMRGSISASAESVLITGTEAVDRDQLAIIEGIILPSASGNVQVRYRAEVDTSVMRVVAATLEYASVT